MNILSTDRLDVKIPADFDGIMAVYFLSCLPFGLARIYREEDKGRLRTSGLAKVRLNSNGSMSVVGKPLMPDDGFGFEDPTIFFDEFGRPQVAFTYARKPIGSLPDCRGKFREDRWAHHVAMPMVMPFPLEDWQPEAIRPMAKVGEWRNREDRYTDLNELKEVELIPNSRIFFCEVGAGFTLPSSIYWGRLNSDSGWPRIASLEPFVFPGERWWASSHVSTGPILRLDRDNYLMFVNGRRHEYRPETGEKIGGTWSIGTLHLRIRADNGTPEVIELSQNPLIEPPFGTEPTYHDQTICFAATLTKGLERNTINILWHDDRRIFATRLRVN